MPRPLKPVRRRRLVAPLAAAILLAGAAAVAAPLVFPRPAAVPEGLVLASATGPSVEMPGVATPAAVSAVPKTRPKPAPTVKLMARRNFTILQIGDSHTAADFFTGKVRQVLQQRFGAGGIILPPGLPHAGIRSDAFLIKASAAWDYQSMAKSGEKDRFWLTGYLAASTGAEAEISYTAPKPVSFDAIDVSFLKKPGGGMVDILLDGNIVDSISLDGPDGEPLIHRYMPFATRLDRFKSLAIRAETDAPVAFTGVYVEQRVSGVSYLSVGFPGAKASILDRIAPKNFADDVTRISPDMVVLAFGTNEGFDDRLDLAEYRRSLTGIVAAIRKARPDVAVVMVGPPAGARKIACDPDRAAMRRPVQAAAVPGEAPEAPPEPAKDCWEVPRNLDPVREAQKAIAAEIGATFWDWSKTLPGTDDLLAGRRGTPPLFGGDRVHLTQDGYRRTAATFASFLIPLVQKGMAGR